MRLTPSFPAVLALVSLVGPGCATSTPRCTRNSDCPMGSYCAAGSCVTDCTPRTVTTDCDPGASCTSFGMCVAASDGGTNDAGLADSGAPVDAADLVDAADTPDSAAPRDGGLDANASDASPTDAARIDAGRTDAAVTDAGPCPTGGLDMDGDRACTGTSAASDCDDTNPAVHPGAVEACNGVDDDCAGGVDDLATTMCSTACGMGTRSCAGGVSTCSAPMPATETCNHLDDDCDAATDEGFPAVEVGTSFSTLATFGPGCSTSYGCNQSIHAFCSVGADRCGQSGIGPVEFVGDAANVECLRANLQATTFADLASYHGSCDASDPYSIYCLAATHRLCATRGLTSGFGPVAVAGSALTVSCVPAAVVVTTSYTEISAVHSGCNGASRIGPVCVHAMHHLCRNRGYRTGFGPLEHSGDVVSVACIP